MHAQTIDYRAIVGKEQCGGYLIFIACMVNRAAAVKQALGECAPPHTHVWRTFFTALRNPSTYAAFKVMLHHTIVVHSVDNMEVCVNCSVHNVICIGGTYLPCPCSCGPRASTIRRRPLALLRTKLECCAHAADHFHSDLFDLHLRPIGCFASHSSSLANK